MAIQSSDPTNILHVPLARKARCIRLPGMNTVNIHGNRIGTVKTVMMGDGFQIISVTNGEIQKMWIDEYRSEAYDRLVEQHWIESTHLSREEEMDELV